MRYLLLAGVALLAVGCQGRVGEPEFEAGDGSVEEQQFLNRLQELADAGNPDEGAALVRLKYWDRAETRTDSLDAIEMYKRYAYEGSVRAASALFRIYTRGEAVEPDTSEAVKWLEVGALNGSDEMQRSLDAWNNREQ